MLGLAYLYPGEAGPNLALQKAGGMFGLLATFAAWYITLAGLADDSNSFFTVPVWHFPWSDKGREMKRVRSRSLEEGSVGGRSEEQKTREATV